MQNGRTSTNPNKLPLTEDSKMYQRKMRREKRGNSASADWAEADPSLVLELITVVSGIGGVTSFGYTKDGGAYYINYYVDGDSDKVYIRPTEDIDAFIRDEIVTWE